MLLYHYLNTVKLTNIIPEKYLFSIDIGCELKTYRVKVFEENGVLFGKCKELFYDPDNKERRFFILDDDTFITNIQYEYRMKTKKGTSLLRKQMFLLKIFTCFFETRYIKEKIISDPRKSYDELTENLDGFYNRLSRDEKNFIEK